MKNEMYIILTLIPLLAGCGDKKEAARGTMPVPEISVASPVVKDITLTKEYPGYLSSEKTVDLVARVNGTLQTIAYAPGSRVRKGQVLFVIEPTIYQDNVEQAEAELNTARANLEYAQNNYARMLEAVKSDAVSQIQVLQSKSNVATSQAAVSNAEAALNTARTNLGYCTVRAPFDGTVSRNQVDVGSYVGGSLQPVTLATIYKDDLLYTYFNITDNQWLAMLMQQGTAQQKDTLPRQITVNLGGRRHTTVSCHTRLLRTECRPEHRNSESACPPGQPERFTEKRTLCQHHLAIRQRIAGNTDTGRVHRYRSIGKICVCSERFRYGALSPRRGGTVDRRQSAANNRRTLATGTLRHPGTDESAGRDESKAHQQITNRK